MVGAGGWAGIWVRHFLPRFEDRLQVVGLVDVDRETLDLSGDLLGLDDTQRFTDAKEAFAKTEPNFCIVCVPPVFRQETIALAVERRLPILCEKPIADSWEASLGILRSVRQAGLDMAVVQNYRLTRRILTVKGILEEGELGRINYINCRFAADYDLQTVGGAFRYKVPNSALYEGSVHHFDQLRNLAEADCDWISGKAWNPAWSDFDNDCCALFVMGMTNGVLCQYETCYTAKGTQNDWHREFFRVECEKGAIVLDSDNVVRLTEHLGNGYTRTTEVEPSDTGYEGPVEHEGHYWTIKGFLDWLDGGPAPKTVIDDNIRTAALSFGAVEASLENRAVDVRAKLAEAGVS